MQEVPTDEKIVRDKLERKRNLLLQEFLKNPSNTRSAIDIRSIDDRIVCLAESIASQEVTRTVNNIMREIPQWTIVVGEYNFRAIAGVLSGRGRDFILLLLSVTRAKRKNILWGMSAAGCPTPLCHTAPPIPPPATPWPFVAMNRKGSLITSLSSRRCPKLAQARHCGRQRMSA